MDESIDVPAEALRALKDEVLKQMAADPSTAERFNQVFGGSPQIARQWIEYGLATGDPAAGAKAGTDTAVRAEPEPAPETLLADYLAGIEKALRETIEDDGLDEETLIALAEDPQLRAALVDRIIELTLDPGTEEVAS